MKIYTVMTFEYGVLYSFEHFRNKNDAISYLHDVIYDDIIQELIKNEYYSDDNGYEIYFKEREI